MGWINNLRSGWQLRTYLQQLQGYNYSQLYRDLGFQSEENEYLLQTQHFNRGRQYVKSFGLLGLSFQKWVGRSITEKERRRIILLSHFAPVYDDLFDKLKTPKERIIELITAPTTVPKNEEETIFLLFYRPVFAEIGEKKTFLNYFLQLTDAQEQSKKQLLPETPSEEILQITSDKGGYSALLLFSLLDEEIKDKKALYQLGACCQYMDDIFDWYDDTSEQRKTIANQLSLAELQQFYTTKMIETTALFSGSFKPLVQTLLTPGHICLGYYQENRIDTSAQPNHRIVCDMEKPRNVLKLIFN